MLMKLEASHGYVRTAPNDASMNTNPKNPLCRVLNCVAYNASLTSPAPMIEKAGKTTPKPHRRSAGSESLLKGINTDYVEETEY